MLDITVSSQLLQFSNSLVHLYVCSDCSLLTITSLYCLSFKGRAKQYPALLIGLHDILQTCTKKKKVMVQKNNLTALYEKKYITELTVQVEASKSEREMPTCKKKPKPNKKPTQNVHLDVYFFHVQ